MASTASVPFHLGAGRRASDRQPGYGALAADRGRLGEEIWCLLDAALRGGLGKCFDDLDKRLFERVGQGANSGEKLQRYAGVRVLRCSRTSFIADFLRRLEMTLSDSLLAPGRAACGENWARQAADRSTAHDPLDLLWRAAVDQLENQHRVALYALGRRFGQLVGGPSCSAARLPIGPAALCRHFQALILDLDVPADVRHLAAERFILIALADLESLYERVNASLINQNLLPELALPSGADPTSSPKSIGRKGSGMVCEPKTSVTGAVPGSADPSVEDIVALLGHLQRKPVLVLATGDRLSIRDANRLKLDLDTQLRQLGARDVAACLAPAVSNTVAAIGVLFDTLRQDLRMRSVAPEILEKLHIPLLRVALGDASLFADEEHPARRVLDLVAQACQRWLQFDAAELSFIEHVQARVERIVDVYDGKLDVFVSACGELSAELAAINLRIELAERRLVDAAKGSEKLETARAQAAEALQRRLRGGSPNRLERALLEGAWTDVTALAHLRHGADSAAFRQRLDVADRLLAVSYEDPSCATEEGRAERETLRAEFAEGLAQLGIANAELTAALDGLFGGAGADALTDDGIEAILRLFATTRLGIGGVYSGSLQTARAPITPALTSAERDVLEQVRSLPFGTWFEFERAMPGETQRSKLVWFSARSEYCLWVNERGMRAEPRSLVQLARELHRDQARVLDLGNQLGTQGAWALALGKLDSPSTNAN